MYIRWELKDGVWAIDQIGWSQFFDCLNKVVGLVPKPVLSPLYSPPPEWPADRAFRVWGPDRRWGWGGPSEPTHGILQVESICMTSRQKAPLVTTVVNKKDKVSVLTSHTFQWEETVDKANKQWVIMSGNDKWGEDKLNFWKRSPWLSCED